MKPKGIPKGKPRPVQRVLIAGKSWEIHKLTPALSVKFLKVLGQDPKKTYLRGFSDAYSKKLYIAPSQHPEDLVDTVLHEGIHAILWELNEPKLGANEALVRRLAEEVLAYLKQTTEIFAAPVVIA